MSLVSTTIPNLVNGVSQQPYSLRLASQCEAQVNAHSSVVEGLRKRPPTRFKARIRNAPVAEGSVFTHIINRDQTERYIVVIQNGYLQVFDTYGNEKAVSAPNGWGYLSCAEPGTSFSVVTVADYTFIVNKTVTVRKSGDVLPTRAPEGMCWIKQGNYSTYYKLFVDNNLVAEYQTPDGSVAEHKDKIRTEYIAQQLVSQFHANTDFSSCQIGSTIHFLRKNGGNFICRSEDSFGDQAMAVIKDSVQRFSDLPKRGIPGFKVQVRGDQTSSFDDYWVEYKDDGSYNGVWQETYKGGELYNLELTTMPHILIRNADGTFTFKAQAWEGRQVGDTDSAPFPSFVDHKISDVFFHRNRLGFISDENVVFSRAGEFFNFFRETITAVLDSDPIDVAVSHTKISLLRHAIPFNETLLLFSDQTQFQLSQGDILTPKTIAINQTTEFESSLLAKPVGAGKNVYFCVNKGKFTGIREYYVDGDTKTNDAADITSHVPKYIPGNVTKLAASSNEDMLVALSRNERGALYVYKYYWSGNEKLQSSWSKWQFPTGVSVLNVDFIESDLYLILQDSWGVYLEVMSLEPGRTDTGLPYTIHLDRRIDSTGPLRGFAYFPDSDVTHVVMLYAVDPKQIQFVALPGGAGKWKEGQVMLPKEVFYDAGPDQWVFIFSGNIGRNWVAGYKYTFRYRFSTLILKEDAVGGGQMSINEGRMQVRNCSVVYNNTGYFRSEVTPFRRQTYQYVFSRIIGSGNNILGQVSLEQGRFKFPVMDKNDQVTIELVNDTYLPCHFLSAEWEGDYTIRSKRL